MLWTDREEALLIKEYPLGDQRDLVLLFRGRSWNAIKIHASRLGMRRQKEVLPEGFKRCSRCEKVKLLAEFHWKRAERGERQSWCKDCYIDRRCQRDAETCERIRESDRQRYAKNPEPHKIAAAARKASDCAAGDLVLTPTQWRQILADWGHRCIYCGHTEKHCTEHRGGKLVREHVIPDSQGGLFTAANIAPACPRCNGRKGPRTPEQAGMQIRWGLYNPTGMIIVPDF